MQNYIKAIYTLLGKNGLREQKENMVRSYTNGRTESVRAMHPQEAKALVAYLKGIDQSTIKSARMKRKAISLALQMGWRLPTGKVDMQHLNDWCTKYGAYHKKLDAHNYKELPRLITQLEGAYRDFIKKQ